MQALEQHGDMRVMRRYGASIHTENDVLYIFPFSILFISIYLRRSSIRSQHAEALKSKSKLS